MWLAAIEYDGKLSATAWLVLFGTLGFLFGILVWGLYRAVQAAKQPESAQRPSE